MFNVDSGWTEVGNRLPETNEIFLSIQIFATFGIPMNLVSDNGPEFIGVDVKQWSESQENKDI